jgi:uncharacterized protein
MVNNRILGFDLARAYAIFGMFIVNFNIVFGSHSDESLMGQFLSLFNGNSSSMFVILAGMGVALMTNRAEYSLEERRKLKAVVMKRGSFLFVFGLIFYFWWFADILHFYGSYLHIAALLLFVPKRFYLWAASASVLIFHVLLFIIPYETGWNFETLQYADFWTIAGFLRNTLYNGWNPVFPWLAFFLLGMWLGRLDWQNPQIKRNVLLSGIGVFSLVEILQMLANRGYFDADLAFYLTADYIPPFLPFMLGTAGFSLIFITLCIFIGEKFAESNLLGYLAKTGQMTLTHYVAHLTFGMIILSVISGKMDFNTLDSSNAISSIYILSYAIIYYFLSVIFSVYWSKRFKNGPLETFMRKFSG